jgi:hypothetical protein
LPSPTSPRDARWLAAAAWALLALVLWRTITLAGLAPLGPDAGFTLMKARLLESGRMPYLDFAVGYGPFQPYLQALYFHVFGRGVEQLRLQQWAHHLVVVLVLAVLLRRPRARWAWVAFAAAVYLASAVAFEGFYFILEPTVSAYGWLAVAAMMASSRRRGVAGRGVAALALAFGAGVLAGVAAGVKQSAALFAPLVVTLAFIPRTPRSRACALAAAAGLAAPFVLFFAVHPSAWRPFLDDSVLGILSLAAGKRLPFEPVSLRLVSLAYTAWIPLALVAAIALRRRAGASLADVITAVALAGLAFWLPQLTRPYLHYALLPLPFAVLALVFALAVAPRVAYVRVARAALLVLALLPLASQGWIEARMRRESEQERTVSAWIERHAPAQRPLLIVPASPQYYYLTGRASYDGAYEFFPDPRSVWHAARAGAPVVVVDRSQGRLVPPYEAELRAAGYRRADALGPHAIWLPPDAPPPPPLAALAPYPQWLAAH